MQTFLPYADFQQSARVLDYRRLGKQRVETLQLVNAIGGLKGWSRHPAALMWEGHIGTLICYGKIMCEEWISRGYKDTCLGKLDEMLKAYCDQLTDPPWLGDERVHSSHRAALLHKDEIYYKQFNWSECPILDYFWPVTKDRTYEKTNNRSEGESTRGEITIQL